MGGQTYNFPILSVLGDASNWDSQFRLVSRAIMIPLVVFLILTVLQNSQQLQNWLMVKQKNMFAELVQDN